MKKKTALAKPTPQALITEQSLHYQGLLSLPLEAMWLLRVIVTHIVKEPGDPIFKYTDGTYEPLIFRITSTEIRRLTRADFSNAAQLVAFKTFRQWEIIKLYEWDEYKGEKGGWVHRTSETGAPFLSGWRIDEWKPFGAKRKADDKNTQVEFFGIINPFAAALASSNLLLHKIHLIPKEACRMKKGSQLLYHRALPHVHKPQGFVLPYAKACEFLGYENLCLVKQNSKFIDGYWAEIVKLTGWRSGKKGEGSGTTWFLFAGPQYPQLGV